jgi:serine/threonine protein kinase
MSSQPRTESPGSKSRQRIVAPLPAEAADDSLDISLASSAPSTDDTPTIISRHSPAMTAITADLESAGVRGRRLAHFELIEPIGVGGMAAVLRARDTQLDRFVALKILPPEMAGDEENVRRFHQEARSAAKLDHDNIARVFFCGEDQRLHFIAFEFVEGENLRAILDRRGRLPVAEALRYMLQVATGLSHAARRGVVHRDIKPSNIIVTPDGKAKLVDMGLARCQEGHGSHDLTQLGVTLGTFDYISPEQALEPREADVRSDIYSLGCTFYHVLTGRSPVPEGTALKKLDCHQHVKPPDPREFVPDLPAEAVLILDRMMAKQPRDRFQSPDELVSQLLVAAGKLGISAEAPEGVLILDAQVPNPPANRALLWAALAIVAVVGLVFVLDQAPTGPSLSRSLSPTSAENGDGGLVEKDKGPRAVIPKENTGPAPVPDLAGRPAVYEPSEATDNPKARGQELRDWVAQHREAGKIELRLSGDLDLSPREGENPQGLILGARQQVTIRALDPKKRPTLRFRYNAQPVGDRAVVALTINAPEVLVEGVRLIIDACEAPDIEMAALVLQGKSNSVRGCEFVQVRPKLRDNSKRVGSLVVEGRKFRSELKLYDCSFLGFGKLTEADNTLSGAETGGQDAVVRRGAVDIESRSCVFGPHSAAFRLEGDGGDDLEVKVHHCSVLLPARRSAVFEATDQDKAKASAKLNVMHSLFSRMPGDADAEGSVLLRADDQFAAVSYFGQNNCYHDLDGYWCNGSDWQQASWSDFRNKKLVDGRGQDESRVLPFNPWKLDPAQQLKALEQQNLVDAFRIHLNLADLRQGRSGGEVVGAENILGERWLPGMMPIPDEKSELALRRCLVVEKNYEDSANRIYKSLDQAVRSARKGDTILIRHNGDLDIDPVHLNKSGLCDLTIRPARRFHPVLVLGETSDAETALFRVHEGKLRLEGLEFRLTPKRLIMQTVVALVGDGECTLKNCVVTLQQPVMPASSEMRLAVATLLPVGSAMKLDMPARRPSEGPKLSLECCFIRGDGDLLYTRATRPLGLEMNKTLVALSGSLLNVGTMPKAEEPKEENYRTQVTLREVTTYLGGPLIRLVTGKDPRGLVSMTVNATGCLFVPAGTGKKMISLEGSDTEERSLRDRLIWEGRQNAFGAFQSMLGQQPSGDEMAMLMDWKKWKDKYGGEEESTPGIEIDKWPGEGRFAEMEPTQFVPPEKAGDCGAKLAPLPRPWKPSADATKDK